MGQCHLRFWEIPVLNNMLSLVVYTQLSYHVSSLSGGNVPDHGPDLTFSLSSLSLTLTLAWSVCFPEMPFPYVSLFICDSVRGGCWENT